LFKKVSFVSQGGRIFLELAGDEKKTRCEINRGGEHAGVNNQVRVWDSCGFCHESVFGERKKLKRREGQHLGAHCLNLYKSKPQKTHPDYEKGGLKREVEKKEIEVRGVD